MEVYAGYLKKSDISKSASGGAASYISACFVRTGIVYGVKYDNDFRGTSYDFATSEADLDKFKGSKYCRSKKYVERNYTKENVFNDVITQLRKQKKVLFIGLGCDIAALKKSISVSKCNSDKLYTVELLCDGVVPEKVQETFVEELEHKYSSKVVEFTLRDKKDGWQLYNAYAKFEDGREFYCPFETSDYGIAFKNYKQKGCYTCMYKGSHHVGDLILGDYWGCNAKMDIYNHEGVSLIILLTEKGRELLNLFNKDEFIKVKIDENYALSNQPRYFTPHPVNADWDIFDKNISEHGLQYAVDEFGKEKMPQRFRNKVYKKFVVWGVGKTFIRYKDLIEQTQKIDLLVDGNIDKWNTEITQGCFCTNPEKIKEIEECFVMIAVQDQSQADEIAKQLNRYGAFDYDFFDNWKWYRHRLKFDKKI